MAQCGGGACDLAMALAEGRVASDAKLRSSMVALAATSKDPLSPTPFVLERMVVNTTAQNICRDASRGFVGVVGPAAPTQAPLQINNL